MIDPLALEDLFRSCDPAVFDFETTAELEPNIRIIGQPRGTQAILFGVEMASPGYNIYAQGEAGTGRTTAIERFLDERAAQADVPSDWVYVHNFQEPHKPHALRLPPGEGALLRGDMARLLDDLRINLPRALESEAFREAAHQVQHNFETARDELFEEMQAKASQAGAAVVPTPGGLRIVPAKDGQALPPEAVAALPEEVQKSWREQAHQLEHELDKMLRQVKAAEREAKEAMQALIRQAAGRVVDRALEEMLERYQGDEDTLGYLQDVRQDIVENVDLFRPGEEDEAPSGWKELRFRRYQVNLLVDHGGRRGAPVVVEYNPTLPRLLGRVEHEPWPGGGMVTDFTLIRGGALHAANGGYLVLRARDLFLEPGSWEALKRALVGGCVRPDDPATRGGAPTRSLDPEPIPLDLKVVLVGPPGVYYALHESDEDFRTLFKVLADFDDRMERSPENEQEYAVFVATRCHEEKLRHLDRGAVARLVEYGSRLAGSQSKLSTRFGDLANLVREAGYWAAKAGHEVVTAEDVAHALEERRARLGLIESRLREQILKGTLLILSEGEVVGQVNGLTVISSADHRFGYPSRVTARVYMGKEGVMQIDREVELAGPIHNKGVMTLIGYLGGRYAQQQPLSLSAQITFEQNYGGVEGDSAASTELYALLSCLSGIPVRQAIAVTGSVDQRGDVQAVGGVTEKVEGWFALVKERRSKGEHGVMVPAANVQDLMLSDEVRRAVAEGTFRLWAVSTVDQGLEILTGRPAEEVHASVRTRLRDLAEGIERFGKQAD